MSSTLLSFKREGALSLEMLQHKRASSSMQGRISWCAWRCGGKLTVSLELLTRRESLLFLSCRPGGTAHVSSGKSDLLWHCEGHLGITRTSLQE